MSKEMQQLPWMPLEWQIFIWWFSKSVLWHSNGSITWDPPVWHSKCSPSYLACLRYFSGTCGCSSGDCCHHCCLSLFPGSPCTAYPTKCSQQHTLLQVAEHTDAQMEPFFAAWLFPFTPPMLLRPTGRAREWSLACVQPQLQKLRLPLGYRLVDRRGQTVERARCSRVRSCPHCP